MNQNLCPFCFEPITGTGPCPFCGHRAGEPMQGIQQLPVGWILDGKYRIGMTLGQGGFGITYLAYDMNLQQKVAIKEYFPGGLVTRSAQTVMPFTQSGQALYLKGVDAFYREARLLAQFSNHPNIVHIQNFFRENNTAYFVMEYVKGKSLASYLDERGGRLSFEEILSLLTPVMDALDVLHQAGILHRDIAPDNIYLTENGTVKLLDFGAAKNELSQHTHSSAAILKPGYAPLEQYSVTGNQGPWTDVYAMGAVIYRCLTGMMPPDAPDRITGREITPISASSAKVSKNVEAAVIKALALNIPDRWQRMLDFKNALSDPNIKIPSKNSNMQKSVSKEKQKKKSKKKKSFSPIFIPFFIILGAVVAWLIITVLSPKFESYKAEKRYNEMFAMMQSGDQEKTIEAFEILDEYRNDARYNLAIEKEAEILSNLDTKIATNILDGLNFDVAKLLVKEIGNINPTKKNTIISECNLRIQVAFLEIGDSIKFGTYEQDNILENGKEKIEWLILDKKDGKLLLISQYALDCEPYNTRFVSVTWETSTLRKWLNNEFLNSAFSTEEQRFIQISKVISDKNPNYNTDSGNNTEDMIFLLGANEAKQYFSTNKERKLKVTEYAKAKGAFTNRNDYTWWWLRTSGYKSLYSADIRTDGEIDYLGTNVNDDKRAIRPALWINPR